MGNYKLVPVATLKAIHRDLDACQNAIWRHGGFRPSYWRDAQARLKEIDELLAAPAVQGEPDAYQRRVKITTTGSKWSGWFECSREEYEYAAENPGPCERGITREGRKLYAAPQSAEQQSSAGDSLTSVPDEVFAAEFAAWWEEHGQFCRAGGGTYEQSFAFEAWRHLYPQLMNLQMAAAEQQPAPHPDEDYRPEELGCPELEPAPDVAALVEALDAACDYLPIGSQALEQVRAALAFRRKQGGEA